MATPIAFTSYVSADPLLYYKAFREDYEAPQPSGPFVVRRYTGNGAKRIGTVGSEAEFDQLLLDDQAQMAAQVRIFRVQQASDDPGTVVVAELRLSKTLRPRTGDWEDAPPPWLKLGEFGDAPSAIASLPAGVQQVASNYDDNQGRIYVLPAP